MRSIAVGVAAIATMTAPACSTPGKVTTSSDDPRSGGRSGFDVTTTAPGATGEPSATAGGAPATTAPAPPVPQGEGEAVLAAVAAYGTALGTPSILALELVVQLPADGPAYAFLQSRDEANPANIDERIWRNGTVGAPEPVVVTGSGDLDRRLFPLDGLDWTAIVAALPGIPALVEAKVGPLSNSSGITHLIATSDLPFSDHIVVRVYVDGGDRHLGGYVQLLADGTVDKVQA